MEKLNKKVYVATSLGLVMLLFLFVTVNTYYVKADSNEPDYTQSVCSGCGFVSENGVM